MEDESQEANFNADNAVSHAKRGDELLAKDQFGEAAQCYINATYRTESRQEKRGFFAKAGDAYLATLNFEQAESMYSYASENCDNVEDVFSFTAKLLDCQALSEGKPQGSAASGNFESLIKAAKHRHRFFRRDALLHLLAFHPLGDPRLLDVAVKGATQNDEGTRALSIVMLCKMGKRLDLALAALYEKDTDDQGEEAEIPRTAAMALGTYGHLNAACSSLLEKMNSDLPQRAKYLELIRVARVADASMKEKNQARTAAPQVDFDTLGLKRVAWKPRNAGTIGAPSGQKVRLQ